MSFVFVGLYLWDLEFVFKFVLTLMLFHYFIYSQDSDMEAMVEYLESVLNSSSLGKMIYLP